MILIRILVVIIDRNESDTKLRRLEGSKTVKKACLLWERIGLQMIDMAIYLIISNT